MLVNVVRAYKGFLTQDLFVLGNRRIGELHYPFWPPVRLLDDAGCPRYGLRWSTAGFEVECSILEWHGRRTAAKFHFRYEKSVFHFRPMEMNSDRVGLAIFNKPTVLRQVGPIRWEIVGDSAMQPVVISLLDDRRVLGQIASRNRLTICDLALAWLGIHTFAPCIPEVYWSTRGDVYCP
jgi:hypothetical protein